MSCWWDKSNSLGSFPWVSSHFHTATLLQWWSSVVAGCETFKIKRKLNQKRMFEKHFIQKKKRNWTWYAFWVRLFSEGKIPGLLGKSIRMKHHSAEWLKFTERMKWKNVRVVGVFLCITVFWPSIDYWNDNMVILDLKKPQFSKYFVG